MAKQMTHDAAVRFFIKGLAHMGTLRAAGLNDLHAQAVQLAQGYGECAEESDPQKCEDCGEYRKHCTCNDEEGADDQDMPQCTVCGDNQGQCVHAS